MLLAPFATQRGEWVCGRASSGSDDALGSVTIVGWTCGKGMALGGPLGPIEDEE
jgi:hypothetical protein